MLPLRTLFPGLVFSCAIVAAQTDAPGAPVKIYTNEPNVVGPQLLPTSSAQSFATGSCRSDEDGTVQFSLIVDASGQPRNIYFLHPNGDDLDLIALKEVVNDRFTPGTSGGQQVAVAVSLEMRLHACLAAQKDARGKTQDVLEVTAAPAQELKPPVDPPQRAALVSGNGLSTNAADPDAGIEKVGGDVKAPFAFPPAASTISAIGRALGEGEYRVSVVVDRYGLPERMKMLEAEVPGHEQAVASLVRLYRWKPAMKDGVPVPVRVEWKRTTGR